MTHKSHGESFPKFIYVELMHPKAVELFYGPDGLIEKGLPDLDSLKPPHFSSSQATLQLMVYSRRQLQKARLVEDKERE